MNIELFKALRHTRATMMLEGLETDKDAENLFIGYSEGLISYDEMLEEIKKMNDDLKKKSAAHDYYNLYHGK